MGSTYQNLIFPKALRSDIAYEFVLVSIIFLTGQLGEVSFTFSIFTGKKFLSKNHRGSKVKWILGRLCKRDKQEICYYDLSPS